MQKQSSPQLDFQGCRVTEVCGAFSGGEVFNFRGDDDVWVFINGRLAIDIGGCHGPVSGTVDLDAQAAELGIVRERNYQLALFQAERCSGGSFFTVELSPNLLTPPPDASNSEFCSLRVCGPHGETAALSEPRNHTSNSHHNLLLRMSLTD